MVLCDKYPVPKTEDILATLNGGIYVVRFITNLSLVSMKSRIKKFTNGKYSQRVFRSSRLKFGVHSSSGIFEKELETRVLASRLLKFRQMIFTFLAKMTRNI